MSSLSNKRPACVQEKDSGQRLDDYTVVMRL